jgi:hypothetical protein
MANTIWLGHTISPGNSHYIIAPEQFSAMPVSACEPAVFILRSCSKIGYLLRSAFVSGETSPFLAGFILPISTPVVLNHSVDNGRFSN